MNTINTNDRLRAAQRRLFLKMAGAGMGAMTLGLMGCGGGEGTELVARSSGKTTCEATTWQLTAGQTTDVGTVTVSNTATELTVTYTLTYSGATFGTLHLWVGDDLADVPKNGQGVPVPGQFPYQHDASGQTSYTFTVPLSELGITTCEPQTLYVVTHAEVNMDGSGTSETAFGGPNAGDGPRWWFYGAYTLCCATEEPEFRSETAYAVGTTTFIALNLTKGQWGWAIELQSPGTTTYDILAGAGNNVGGTHVGTLTVDWDGSQASVTWALTGGTLMSLAHLYAGDTPPTKTAPGLYGNTYSFDPWVSEATRTVALVDSADADGAWLVAHAEVQIPV